MTVQETFFARDVAQLRVIPWASLRGWRAGAGLGGPIRVWSAGCATGEEAYTLALEATLALGCSPAPVDVLGTDISPAALAAAEGGCYGGRAVRLLAPAVRERYLRRQPDGRYQVTAQLQVLTRFRRHNLALAPGPPPGEAAFDVVVCRNVLIYLSTRLIGRAVGNLERALRPGGVLVLGAADVLHRTAAQKAPSGPAPVPPGPGPQHLRPRMHNAPGRVAAVGRRQRLAAALEAADAGNRAQALAEVSRLLAAPRMTRRRISSAGSSCWSETTQPARHGRCAGPWTMTPPSAWPPSPWAGPVTGWATPLRPGPPTSTL